MINCEIEKGSHRQPFAYVLFVDEHISFSIHDEIAYFVCFSVLANMGIERDAVTCFISLFQLERELGFVAPCYKELHACCSGLKRSESPGRYSGRTSIERTDERRSIYAADTVEQTLHLSVCVDIKDMHESFRAVSQVGEWRWSLGDVYCVNATEFAIKVTGVQSL